MEQSIQLSILHTATLIAVNTMQNKWKNKYTNRNSMHLPSQAELDAAHDIKSWISTENKKL